MLIINMIIIMIMISSSSSSSSSSTTTTTTNDNNNVIIRQLGPSHWSSREHVGFQRERGPGGARNLEETKGAPRNGGRE